ncbi:MAG: diaminopimelate epimerase [Planctomycetes bacterium]|nr:diaminopimelate epimerase [Planctomycetota bacterium]
MRFTKMHGCGNDYIYIDAWGEQLPADLPALARAVSDRHTGIGGDGLIIIGPDPVVDARMRMLNADGSESEMCGNGIRCAAKLAWDNRRVRRPHMTFSTGAGHLDVDLHLEGERCTGATVAMGRPRLVPDEVPVEHAGPGPRLALTIVLDGEHLHFLAVGMGNPHAVCFVPDPDVFPVASVGPKVERHPRFPRRTNVEFVARLPDEHGLPVLRQRTWERGSGETQACGTGACAVLVAAVLEGVIPGREAVVRLNGGDLRIAWPGPDRQVVMSGPAVTVFAGDWPVPG